MVDFDLSRFRVFLVLVLGILLIPLINAGFSTGDPSSSISDTYGPETNLSGWINISFEDEPGDSLFRLGDDLDGSISLRDLIKLNPSYEHVCNPLDCESSYSESNGQTSKSFLLNENDSILVGLSFQGNFLGVDSFSMDVSTDASESSVPQLEIDVLNDNSTEWLPSEASGNFGDRIDGCYDSPADGQGLLSSSNPLYENLISSPPLAPNIKIGAVVNRFSEGSANLTVQIKNVQTDEIGFCEVNNIDVETGEIECIPKVGNEDFGIKEDGDFIVSIWASTPESENKYNINYKVDSECRGSSNENFELFIKPGNYSSISDFSISDSQIETDIENYIFNRYSNNCENGCVVPITFNSQASQTVDLSNLLLIYRTGGVTSSSDKIYDITEAPVIINSEYGRLFLDNSGLSVPSSTGTYDFSLDFESSEILSKEIEVKDVPIIESITPLSTAAGFPTEFFVDMSFPSNTAVRNYIWDFGDNETDTTSTNQSIHIYHEIGNYTLTLTVTDTRGLSSSKSFEIEVVSPKDLINSTLDEMSENLENIKSYINIQDSFKQLALESTIGIDDAESELDRLNSEFLDSENESEYMDLVGDILNLRIPRSIFITKQANSFIFIPESNSIEPSVVEAIAGGDYNSNRESDYINSILSWQYENLDSLISFNEFSAEYDDNRIQKIVNVFEFQIVEKKDINYDYYFVVSNLDDINFNIGVQEQGNYKYVNLGNSGTFNFYTTEDVSFSDLPGFISPPISRLSLESSIINIPEEEETRKTILILSFVGLFILAIVAYVVLQQWYKKRYQDYLFPNKNDLYNLVNYVNNSKKKGLTKDEVSKNLRKSKWTSEQINYVLKKYEGKRTGMVELPAPKFKKSDEGNPNNIE